MNNHSVLLGNDDRDQGRTALVQELLHGAVDTHAHTMPTLYTPGKLDDLSLAQDAVSAGMMGYVSKNTEMPTVAQAELVMKVTPGIRIWSSIVLNSPVGGINPDAVWVALGLGARVVWLPTTSSASNQSQAIARNQAAGVAPVRMPARVDVLDGAGRLLPALYEIFDLVKQANAVLATGDISAREGAQIAREARAYGVDKVVITHPEVGVVNMPLEQQVEMARLGCYIEHCYATVAPGRGVTPEDMARNIRAAGVTSAIFATDYGKTHQPSPVQGMREGIAAMLAAGLSPADVRRMIQDNPLALLGE
jgi:hypothetical protein